MPQAKLDHSDRGIAVDGKALAPHNTYAQPDFVERGYYIDKPFECRTCGRSQTWTATQQKWWYEVAKGDVFSTANRCRSCRQRARREEIRLKGGDPNPYKNGGLLLARIRAHIEPKLLSAGYCPIGKNRRGALRALFIDYGRSDHLFTLSWDQHNARLAAQLLTNQGSDLREIAAAEFTDGRSTSDVEARIEPFMASVQRFLDGLQEPPTEPEL